MTMQHDAANARHALALAIFERDQFVASLLANKGFREAQKAQGVKSFEHLLAIVHSQDHYRRLALTVLDLRYEVDCKIIEAKEPE